MPKGRTVFVRPDDPTQPCPDQWQILAKVQTVPGTVLDRVIESESLSQEKRAASAASLPSGSDTPGSCRSYGLPPCAQKMLGQGVRAYQRVACLRVGGHLRRAGFPLDITIAALKTWAQKNAPADDKRVITEDEIVAQTTCAYQKRYRSSGCEDPAVKPYCDPECPVRRNGAAKNKTRES